MRRCIFCGQPLDTGTVFHDNDNCRSEMQKITNLIYADNRITVGMGTCGISAGARETLEELQGCDLCNGEGKIPVELVGCAGMCYNEPVVTIRVDGKTSIYAKLTKDKVPKLIESIKNRARFDECFVAETLQEIDFFKMQKRILMKRCGTNSPLDLKQYIATGGFSGLSKALKIEPEKVIGEIQKAGLRGRGGAGFSTAVKWGLLSDKTGTKCLIVNADEGDPGAFMNRTLMESDPFQVIEGLIIGSYATGATQGIIYTRAEYPLAVETLNKAISILLENNILGENILGKEGFDFNVRIKMGAGAFVCGEETALMRSIEGKRGHPSPRPPYPSSSGVFGLPSNINNVETYAHVANIMNMGFEEFCKNGTQGSPGTKCICLTGKIKNAGVIEIELGITLRDIIYRIGGGIKNDKRFKAVQTGGPSGGCIIESEIDTPLDFDNIPKLGTIMGSGGLVVMDEEDCMVHIAKFFLTFTTEESCGKCVPCREGTKRMLEILDLISKGAATENDLLKLEHLAAVVQDTSLCGLGQSAPNPVLSTINKFRDEYLLHINDKKCPTGICEALISYIITDKCIGCGNCERHCPADAITGELKSKFTIDQDKCIKCGLCYRKCAFSAIVKK